MIDDEYESVVEPAAITAPLEALLLMATEPMPTAELAQAVRAPVALVERALAHLAEFYDETGRGFELRYVGGGWRYWTRAGNAGLIGGWLIEGSTRQANVGPPSKPWRWWPTCSPSHAAGSLPSAV